MNLFLKKNIPSIMESSMVSFNDDDEMMKYTIYDDIHSFFILISIEWWWWIDLHIFIIMKLSQQHSWIINTLFFISHIFIIMKLSQQHSCINNTLHTSSRTLLYFFILHFIYWTIEAYLMLIVTIILNSWRYTGVRVSSY